MRLTNRQLNNFLKKVDKTAAGCWLWGGALDGKNYGRFRVGKLAYFAHRISYSLYKGDLLPGLDIDHLCKVRNCVNPDHLEQVTHHINLLRRLGKNGLTISEEVNCPLGHPYKFYNKASGELFRSCRVCKTNKQRIRRLKAHEATADIEPKGAA